MMPIKNALVHTLKFLSRLLSIIIANFTQLNMEVVSLPQIQPHIHPCRAHGSLAGFNRRHRPRVACGEPPEPYPYCLVQQASFVSANWSR